MRLSFFSISIISIFLFSTHVYAQREHTEVVLDEILNHAQENSLYRDKVNWETLREEVTQKTLEADSVSHL